MFGDDHEVFNTETAEPPTIEPRFDSHDIPGLKKCCSRRIYEGFLMNQQADAMACSVGEILVESGLGEHFSASCVNLRRQNSWSTRLNSGLLC